MASKKYRLNVRGRQHEWGFIVELDPQYLQDWRDDGLELDEVVNSIPAWLPGWLVRPWVYAQDVFNFRRPGR